MFQSIAVLVISYETLLKQTSLPIHGKVTKIYEKKIVGEIKKKNSNRTFLYQISSFVFDLFWKSR